MALFAFADLCFDWIHDELRPIRVFEPRKRLKNQNVRKWPSNDGIESSPEKVFGDRSLTFHDGGSVCQSWKHRRESACIIHGGKSLAKIQTNTLYARSRTVRVSSDSVRMCVRCALFIFKGLPFWFLYVRNTLYGRFPVNDDDIFTPSPVRRAW